MKILKITVLAGIVGVSSTSANAAVTMFNDLSTFNSLGNSSVVSDFEEFNQSGFDFPSDPYLQGGVSYESTDNLTINDNTGYTANGSNMLTNNYWNPLKGSFYEEFSLFGFDGGWSNQDDNGTTIVIGTNLDSYTFNVDFDIASSADFYGFSAGQGEYFTSFNITSNYNSALNAIDNVRVGTVSAVPEPSTYALMLGGLGLVGFMAARRRKA